MDWLGCSLVGATSHAGQTLASYAASSEGEGGRCFTIGAGMRDAEGAAFVNGGLGNIFELDDVHRKAILHAGDVVMPAALATAQSEETDAPALLNAIVCGYEVAIRIGEAAAANGYSAWYNSGTCGVFGAAMAAGLVLNLDRAELADALGQAGMQASGIWQCRLEPTYSKQLATARAAQAGVASALLARSGFTGARQILEGELGFFAAYYPNADQAAVTAQLEGPWKILDVSFKPWPACRHAHPAIEAALALRNEVSADTRSKISVSTYAAAVDFCDNVDPKSDHEARFSLQHCVAVALLRGAPGLEDFSSEARGDPSIASLRNKINLIRDEEFTAQFPGAYGARIQINGSGDMEHSVSTAKGDPENPMTADELEQKFTTLAQTAGVSDRNIRALIDVARGLAREEPMNTLNKALAGISTDLAKTQP